VNRRKRAPAAKGGVLKDYKKVGATFVPPIVHQIGSLDFISWTSQTLPELIWWDVVMDRSSPRFAARIAEEFAKHFKNAQDPERWWVFISDYAHVSQDDIDRLKEQMAGAGMLTLFLESLAEFLNLYPECPMWKFLEHRPMGTVDISYLSHFESRMEELENKRSRNGVLVQAQAVYMGFVLGRLHVKRGLALADFPEVERYPTTDRSKQVGASICATVNMLAGRGLPKYAEDVWVQYFWQRSLELHPLNFGGLVGQ